MLRLYKNIRNSYLVLRIPVWVTRVYIILAAVLLPWTIYLSLALPDHHVSAHWNISWTGLDIGLVISLIATGLFGYFQSSWVIIAATTTGSLLLVDAWFDVMSEKQSADFHQALILAFAFELPLAALSYYLASHALKRKTRRKPRRSRMRDLKKSPVL